MRISGSALVAAAVVAVTGLLGAAPSQAVVGACPATPSPRTFQASPGADLKGLASSLCPGDQLVLGPGTYAMGDLRLYDDPAAIYGRGGIHRGTASYPITITSADSSQEALLLGSLQLTGAQYWRIDHVRVQATVPGRAALTMNGGVGWRVTSSEFWGARATNAMSNVTIAGSGGYPRGFLFAWNRVHDAAQSTRTDATDHNIYVSFQGSLASGGVITRNLIWNAPHGAGLKLGDGGAYNALGPWGVTVSFNTFYDNGRQILLHGNVRNNAIYGNLLVRATQRFVTDTRTTEIYIHDVTGRNNVFHHNYGFAASMLGYDLKHAVTWGTGNRMANDWLHDPRFTGSLSGAYLSPTNRTVLPYGRYGTGRW